MRSFTMWDVNNFHTPFAFWLRRYIGFIIGFILVVLIKITYYPTLTIHPQLWAESASNYLSSTMDPPLLKRLLMNDGGYLPLLPRLLAMAISLAHVPMILIPFVYQWISISFVAALSVCISLPYYRKIISSDSVRFVIALAIGFFDDYEIHAFQNVAYFGMIPLVLQILFPLRIEARGWLTLLIALCCLSKGQFIIFLPITISLAFYFFKGRQFPVFKSYLWISGALGVQLLYCLIFRFVFHPSVSNGKIPTGLDFIQSVWAPIRYALSVFGEQLIGRLFSGEAVSLAIVSGVFILVGSFYLFKNKKFTYLWALGVAFWIVFATSFLWLLWNRDRYAIDPYAIFPPIGASSRHEFLGKVAVFLVAVVMGRRLCERFGKVGWVVMVCLLSSGGTFYFRIPRNVETFWGYSPFQSSLFIGFESWSALSSMFSSGVDYCIPINPYPWIVGRNCFILASPASVTELTEAHRVLTKENVDSAIQQRFTRLVAVAIPELSSLQAGLTLKAYDSQGNLLGQGKYKESSGRRFGLFVFEPPIQGIKSLTLEGNRPVYLTKSGKPVWAFYGS